MSLRKAHKFLSRSQQYSDKYRKQIKAVLRMQQRFDVPDGMRLRIYCYLRRRPAR